MDKMPTEWVERIFERLACIYKERWTSLLGSDGRKNLLIAQWCTGLAGLSAEQIKRALTNCEFSGEFMPPTVMDFYHLAKGNKILKRNANDVPMTVSNREVAKLYLTEIRNKIHLRIKQAV